MSASARLAAMRSRSERAAMPASSSPDLRSLAFAKTSRRSAKTNRSSRIVAEKGMKGFYTDDRSRGTAQARDLEFDKLVHEPISARPGAGFERHHSVHQLGQRRRDIALTLGQ